MTIPRPCWRSAPRWWRSAAAASGGFPIAAFFTGPFTTALRTDEILVEIRVPIPPARSGGAYVKIERKVGDFATAAVAVQVALAADGTCARAGIGLTNVGAVPIKASQAEAALVGQRLDEAVIKRAAGLAAAAPSPPRTCADRSSTRRISCES